ncbi:MAG: YciI-like protein, partial [Bacteroidota bacterium]
LLLYEMVEGYLEKRQPYREEHLALAQAAVAEGSLVLGGAFANPADGAALVFKGDNPQIATGFAEQDPYVKNGIVAQWTVREWTVVVGGE